MDKQYFLLADSVADSCISDLESLLSSTDWNDLGTTDNVKGYSKSIDSLELIKAVGMINYLPEDVSEYLLDLSHKKDWDEMLLESKTLYDYGDVKILHETFKAPWPVSARDFVFVIKKIVKGDDVMFVARSVDVGVPEQEGVVRGECKTSGFYLKNVEDIATEMTYIVSVDPKGMIPTAIVNFAARQQVGNVNKIMAAMNSQNI